MERNYKEPGWNLTIQLLILRGFRAKQLNLILGLSVITSLAFTVYSPGTAAQNIPGKNLPRGRVIHAEAIRITESEPSKNQGKGILECEGVGQFPVPFLVPAEAGGLLLYIRWHTIPCPTLKAKPHVTIRSSDLQLFFDN